MGVLKNDTKQGTCTENPKLVEIVNIVKERSYPDGGTSMFFIRRTASFVDVESVVEEAVNLGYIEKYMHRYEKPSPFEGQEEWIYYVRSEVLQRSDGKNLIFQRDSN